MHPPSVQLIKPDQDFTALDYSEAGFYLVEADLKETDPYIDRLTIEAVDGKEKFPIEAEKTVIIFYDSIEDLYHKLDEIDFDIEQYDKNLDRNLFEQEIYRRAFRICEGMQVLINFDNVKEGFPHEFYLQPILLAYFESKFIEQSREVGYRTTSLKRHTNKFSVKQRVFISIMSILLMFSSTRCSSDYVSLNATPTPQPTLDPDNFTIKRGSDEGYTYVFTPVAHVTPSLVLNTTPEAIQNISRRYIYAGNAIEGISLADWLNNIYPGLYGYLLESDLRFLDRNEYYLNNTERGINVPILVEIPESILNELPDLSVIELYHESKFTERMEALESQN